MKKNMADIILVPLTIADREQFIKDNQEAFNYGALEEFGRRDDHFEEDEQIISRKTVENSIDSGEAYRIMLDGVPVGGVIIKTDGNHGELEILFVAPKVHSKGIGYSAWCAVEKMHPEVTVWETVTPYFEKRNIHFYVNCCGFQIVEFWNRYHHGPAVPEEESENWSEDDEMFVFRKIMN
jgi:GNAT superfamily N-acetyltransferase